MDERRRILNYFEVSDQELLYYIIQLIILHLSVEYLPYRSTEMMLRIKKKLSIAHVYCR